VELEVEKLLGEVVSRPLETSNGTLTQLRCVKGWLLLMPMSFFLIISADT
jgi:hypothetical protein